MWPCYHNIYSTYYLKFISKGFRLYVSHDPKLSLQIGNPNTIKRRGKARPSGDMDIRIDAIQNVTDIPECVSISQIQQASAQDAIYNILKAL